MPHDQAYIQAEKKIEEALRSNSKKIYLRSSVLTELPESIAQITQLEAVNLSYNYLSNLPRDFSKLTQLTELNLSDNQFAQVPEVLRKLKRLRLLDLSYNKLSVLPEWLGELTQLQHLKLSNNQFTKLPAALGKLTQLKSLILSNNKLKSLPESLGNLKWLGELDLGNNHLIDLPGSLAEIYNFYDVVYGNNSITKSNPLNPELIAVYKEGLDAIKSYLRSKADAQITLYEAKLILIGEGEVGKTCLADALQGNPWEEHPSTHGIQIRQVRVTDSETQKEITLNSWDFGGQRVYRPTHQLFFSAPAVYLVVWKPREGPQAGQVREWIQLVRRREPSAKILVVATHGGPQQRQPDIDRQELWDLFGKETIVDFFFVDSKPDEQGHRKGIAELKQTIARVATTLAEVGRSVPKSFADVRATLQATGAPYLPLGEVLAICQAQNMDYEIARLFITISHRLGHLTYYEHDPALRDIVILRPDWLATAMSYALDDEQTRLAHGLVKFSRLSQLWDDSSRAADSRYPATLHQIFLRLMERFDLSYRVADPLSESASDPLSLIGQLVPDIRPMNMETAWSPTPSTGDLQQTQICRIVDKQTGQSATAEGLFYQLIVRLHKYSLGRVNYNDSVHWQRGLVLDNSYNGRAFLEHKVNDIHITVRAPYPERFLAMLTEEVKYLVESFWEGLSCDVMVPCVAPCGKDKPGTNLFEVEKLIAFRRKGLKQFPCTNSGCESLQDIDQLLLNAPAAQPDVTRIIISEFAAIKAEVQNARVQLSAKMSYQGDKIMDRFDRLDDRTRRTLSQVDKTYSDLLQLLTDEAKEGPRLFSLVPVNRSDFNPKEWTSEKFKLILWCEHIRMPLPIINGRDSQKGVYELEFTRDWFKKAAPFLKLMTSALSLALPIAVASTKLNIDKALYDSFEDQFNFGKEIIDATLSASDKADLWKVTGDSAELPQGIGIRGENATLRELHALLKAKDPGFGGLVRVMNKRQEFLWVHEKFASEY